VRTSLVTTALLLFTAGAVAPQSVSRTRLSVAEVANWREDLSVLASELPRRHRNAFARMTRADWDSAVKRLDARIPQLARYEVIVELMRLVAMVHDGHTFLLPRQDAIGFHRLPVRMYDFADGLFIIAADSAHASLAGGKVVRIGRATAAEALDSASRLVSHEGLNWARLNGALMLAIPEVLAALSLTYDSLTATFVVEKNDRQQTVRLEPIGLFVGDLRDNDWVDMRSSTSGDDPLWLQQPDAPFWFTILPDGTLYIGYRAVQFIANGELNEAFFRRAFAAGDSARVERVVLDIRTNGGGNNFLNRFLVREIIRRPALDQPDRFLVLIGRGIFSAAQNLVNELDYYTNATFVGEPTGNAPNQYGDPRPLELPRSHLRVFVSSLLWQGHMASDDRAWFTPDVFVEMTSADYRARRDPVLATALRRAGAPGLDQSLAADAERGDTSAVHAAIEAYRANTENRYRNLEADVNDAGYRLLRAGHAARALSVFQVNAALFPRSANVYDSLGEALSRAGRRDEAIVAYRRALQLNPNMFSSRDALRRFGVAP
jgi:tetratricopeptide (TPR) repeat protein